MRRTMRLSPMSNTEATASTAARSLAEPSSAGSLLKVPLGRWRIRKGAWLWVTCGQALCRSLYVARAVQEQIIYWLDRELN